MVMQHLNKKGFILLDSLICVLITSLLCVTCYSLFLSANNYDDGYIEYIDKSNSNIEQIFNEINECEACTVHESD